MNRKMTSLLASIIALTLAGASNAQSPGESGGGPALADQRVTQSAEGSRSSSSFPTYWIGEYPPHPPLGYAWRFLYRDYYGRAHWQLVIC